MLQLPQHGAREQRQAPVKQPTVQAGKQGSPCQLILLQRRWLLWRLLRWQQLVAVLLLLLLQERRKPHQHCSQTIKGSGSIRVCSVLATAATCPLRACL